MSGRGSGWVKRVVGSKEDERVGWERVRFSEEVTLFLEEGSEDMANQRE